jgi:heme/copper-type cytochrome/quinol oxidase subunit 3
LPPAAVVGTAVLIAGDVMLFAGLLFVFWVLRLGAPVWPPPLQPRLPLGLTAMNTLVLLASGLIVDMGIPRRASQAPRAPRPGKAVPFRDCRDFDRGRSRRWLGVGAALGALFLVVQGYEWVRIIGFGLTVTSGTYGALFYTLIGAHALHVLVALVWLSATLARLVRGSLSGHDGAVEACGLYWRFVVALWPVLYLCIYLL